MIKSGNSIYLIGLGDKEHRAPKPKQPDRPSQYYKDDGLVITMHLANFFSDAELYATFLTGTNRSYISLVDDDLTEAFQFSLGEIFNSETKRSMKVLGSARRNIAKVMDLVGPESSSFQLKTKGEGKPIGILHPMVSLRISEIAQP